jgi:hypothetical protein
MLVNTHCVVENHASHRSEWVRPGCAFLARVSCTKLSYGHENDANSVNHGEPAMYSVRFHKVEPYLSAISSIAWVDSFLHTLVSRLSINMLPWWSKLHPWWNARQDRQVVLIWGSRQMVSWWLLLHELLEREEWWREGTMCLNQVDTCESFLNMWSDTKWEFVDENMKMQIQHNGGCPSRWWQWAYSCGSWESHLRGWEGSSRSTYSTIRWT